MLFLFAALLCLTSGLDENALARANKLLRKEHEALVKALDAITKEQSVGSYVSADCTAHLNEPDCLVHGCQWDGYCQMQSSEEQVAGGCYTSSGSCKSGYYKLSGGLKCCPRLSEMAVSAEKCDSYCEDWSKFKESKEDDKTQEEICGMYMSKRCSTCEDVQAYCGWKKVTEDEVYSYSVSEGGKCMTLDGKDPKHEYFGGKGSECEKTCDARPDCFGYSISGYDNCLIWLQRDIMGGGEEWGGADCHMKDLQCTGNVGEDYNCFECFNGYNGKYLWGNTCYAKDFGADTYSKGVCGNEYKCFTGGEDIGECPYGEYCPAKTFEVALGAEACDSYCEDWSKFKESKDEDKTQEEICGMYKSTRCSTCEDVQAYCGWKKVTEKEQYSYSVSEGGKCMTLDGEDPKHEYFGGKGSECEMTCDARPDCFGYSISGYDNCLIWLQRDIMGGGQDWGGADCHIKDLQCSGNAGDDYNCFECFNGYNGKYLWGNTCYAKDWGSDTYSKGVCGNEYKCFTGGEDIGECPYDSYCPSA